MMLPLHHHLPKKTSRVGVSRVGRGDGYMWERVQETFESPVVPAAIPAGSQLMRVKYLYTLLPTTHYKQILSSQTQTRLRDGDRGGTETAAVAVAWRGQQQWHILLPPREWVDGVGSASLWAGSMLGL